MERTAEYLIFQHIPDLFRHETSNVGVLVRVGDVTAARFFGETEPGKINGHKIKGMPHPQSYAQWVEYWRRTLARDPVKGWEKIRSDTDGNYRAQHGGELTNIGQDSIDDVLTYAYALLVSEGKLAEALNGPDESQAVVKLTDAIADELKRFQVLFSDDGEIFSQAKYPVRAQGTIVGKKVKYHHPSFIQLNGHPAVMEPIDLTVRRDRGRIKERAGFASYMFGDIREEDPTAETIAIVRMGEEKQDDNASYALAMLNGTATEIVDWSSKDDRQKFLERRAKVAVG